MYNFIEIYDNSYPPWFLQDENYSFRNEFFKVKISQLQEGEKAIEIHNLLKKVFEEQKQEFGVLVLLAVGGDGVSEKGVCWASEI
jgi:hypothetical protein